MTGRNTIISTGRNTATVSGNTMPWMLTGIPSRNGMTRTRSAIPDRKARDSRPSSPGRTQRRPRPPPFMSVPFIGGPNRAAAPVQRVGCRPDCPVVGGNYARRSSRQSGGVPEGVDSDLVLQHRPRRGPRSVGLSLRRPLGIPQVWLASTQPRPCPRNPTRRSRRPWTAATLLGTHRARAARSRFYTAVWPDRPGSASACGRLVELVAGDHERGDVLQMLRLPLSC